VVDKASGLSETGATPSWRCESCPLDGYVERKDPAIVGIGCRAAGLLSPNLHRRRKSVYYRRLVAAGEDQRNIIK
jgi:hypothetical protein